MRILVLGYKVGHSASGGGSGRFMQCVADTLASMGHEVITSTEPEKHIHVEYDLIICSHFLYRIEKNPSPKIYISHGIVNNERLYPGADKYVSVSEEAKIHNLKHGIFSEIINQPIRIGEQKRSGSKLKNILIIRRGDVDRDPFAFLSEVYDLRISDPETPIEDQIEWADLCITLGRGALESMAQGKPVLVADCRDYIGAIGDGYVSAGNIHEIAKNNFSGRRYKIPLTQEWIESELAKYNPDDSDFLHKYVSEKHEAKQIVKEYLNMVDPKPMNHEIQNGLISIIIPVLNQSDMTHEALQAVMENTEGYEVVIIDNGSDPPFKPPFSGFNEIRIIRNEENKGYPVAINQGVQEAKGEFIILLNNDVVVTPGALNRLAGWLDAYDIIGPLTNYAGGLQAVQIPAYNSIDELNDEAEALSESSEGESQEVNWIIGFCMAFKRSTWDKVGNFDESLWPCSGEELNFCLEAKEKEFKIGIALDTYVHHEGSITFADMEDDGQLKYKKICARNDKYLKDKWGFNVWNHQLIKEDPVPTSGTNLNLGCGYKKIDGFINIDNRADVNPDLICDVIEGLPYEDNSIDSVRAHDFLEHIPIGKVIPVMDEIWRVLKPGGKFDSLTPDAENGQAAFQDPGHVSFWVENSWLYYSKDKNRDLYGIKANFKMKSLARVESDPRIYHLRVIAEAVKGEE